MGLRVIILLAVFVVGVAESTGNVQAQNTVVQDDCTTRYQILKNRVAGGEWDGLYQMVKNVRACSISSGFPQEKIEYTYVAEVRALRETGSDDKVLQLAHEVLGKNLITERRDFLSYILELAGVVAYSQGKADESLHLLELATYDDGARDLGQRLDLQWRLFHLQMLNRDVEGAEVTLGTLKDITDQHSDEIAPAKLFKAHQEIAEWLFGRLVSEVNKRGGRLDTTEAGVTSLWSSGRFYQRLAQGIAKDLSPSRSSEYVSDLRFLDIQVAMIRGDREQALQLLSQWDTKARSNKDHWDHLAGLSVRARTEIEWGNYARALDILSELEQTSDDYGVRAMTPLVLSARVRIASDAGNAGVARRALDQLAALDQAIPEKVYREAAGAYASVFRATSENTGLPSWLILALSIGLAGILQFVAVATRKDRSNPLSRSLPPSIAGPGPDRQPDSRHKQATPAASSSAFTSSPSGTSCSRKPVTGSRKQQDEQQDEQQNEKQHEQHGDGFAFSRADTAWLRGMGISIDDVPHVEPAPGGTPSTIGDVMQRTLTDTVTIRCYDAEGARAFDMPLPAHVIEHATQNRFMAIDLPDSLLIVYRYARPQHSVVKQDADGGLRLLELDASITAVPVARIQRDA